VVDQKSNAKLKVSFFLWFAGDYWIIDLGRNYEYAVVGSPGRDYLWVLSRQPVMEEALYSELLNRAASQGYDINRVRKTLHP
jgi:apolipoprotein D and lipocalin family protein